MSIFNLKYLKPGFLLLTGSCFAAGEEKPNVLFIMVDDLRPTLGTYDYPEVKTPNIDLLASQGVQFNKAFCNVPVSGASRASLLTGIRPNYPTRFTDYRSSADKDAPGVMTIPELFKNNGYTTISNGKFFHHRYDRADAWSEPSWRPDTSTVINYRDIDWIDSTSLQYINPKTGSGPYFEAATAPDSLYFDNKVASKSVRDLKRLADEGKPFFLGVGFHKPHLPFNAPKRFYDLYPDVEIADNRFPIKNSPKQVVQSQEIFNYGRLEKFNTDEFHKEARRAYYACVSYVDEQIGRVLDALKDNGLEDNTIVILIGDHGWNLGEHNLWGKHNVLYECLHSPLIIKAPGLNENRIDKIVEFVDIYPTLSQLVGLLPPENLDGESMVGLMRGVDDNWKDIAISEWKGARTITTHEFSYTLWIDKELKGKAMLFNHLVDFKQNDNVVDDPRFRRVVDRLRGKLLSYYNLDN
jgi:iduronate 2-sulfatase